MLLNFQTFKKLFQNDKEELEVSNYCTFKN